MHREGNTIIFEPHDRARVAFSIPSGVQAERAVTLYRTSEQEVRAIADELDSRLQSLSTTGARAMAQEAACAQIDDVKIFQSDLGRLATNEIAAALAAELPPQVYRATA